MNKTGRSKERRKGVKGQRSGPSPARDAFHQLLDGASPDVLRQLVERLTAKQSDLRREALDFLMGRVPDLSSTSRSAAKAELALSLWAGAEPGLREMEEYSGFTDDKTERRTFRLLGQLREHLRDEDNPVPVETRRAILDEVVQYLAADIPRTHDDLLWLAYAACHGDDDIRDLAERFAALDSDWLLEEAIRLYRALGDQDTYLALRLNKLESGFDYLDLATFYWESKDREEAIETAREGLELGRGGGRQELRAFLAQRAKEAGNRAEYVDLLFAQTIEEMTLEGYKAFKKLCTSEEWAAYEPRLMAELDGFDPIAQMEIHILRKEYEEAVALLPPAIGPGDDEEGVLRAAEQLEVHLPDKLLTFYQSLLGPLNSGGSRAEYRRRARVLAKVRHMWVDVLKTPEAWLTLARRVQGFCQRRPACQEEFERIIPGWPEEVRGAAVRPAAGRGDRGETKADPALTAPTAAPSMRQLELPLSSQEGSDPDVQAGNGREE